MKLTIRQEAYRKYLKSDHWKQLRALAMERDGGLCVRCHAPGAQVHHVRYRTPWESALLEDLETICIPCHRKEHGFAPAEVWPFDILYSEMNKFATVGRRATAAQFKELQSLIANPRDLFAFGRLMQLHVWFSLGWALRDDRGKELGWMVRDYHCQRATEWMKALDEDELAPMPPPVDVRWGHGGRFAQTYASLARYELNNSPFPP